MRQLLLAPAEQFPAYQLHANQHVPGSRGDVFHVEP